MFPSFLWRRGLFLLGILALVLVGILAIIRSEPSPAFFVSYTSFINNTQTIFVMNSDGSYPRAVTQYQLAVSNQSPRWAPNSKSLAYVANDTLTNQTRIQRLEFSGHTNYLLSVGDSPEDSSPTWSPNGHWIVYQDNRGNRIQLNLVKADGTQRVSIAEDTTNTWNHSATWSPDSRSLAFVSNRSGNDHLYKFDILTQEIAQLTPSLETRINAAYAIRNALWSPDGQTIVFELYDTDRAVVNLMVVKPDGTDLRLVSPASLDQFRPSWSPDSQWVAFNTPVATGGLVFVVRVEDGYLLQMPIDSKPSTTSVKWSPDGNWLYYDRIRGNTVLIYRLNIGTRQEEFLGVVGFDPTLSGLIDLDWYPSYWGVGIGGIFGINGWFQWRHRKFIARKQHATSGQSIVNIGSNV